MKIVGMIPVRMESSRLPDKPMKDICGLPMIVHVYERSKLAKKLDKVYVVTDSKEIADTILQRGGDVIMTKSSHQNGSERLAEAAESIDADIIINIQGDEALVDPDHIDLIASKFPNDCKTCPVGLLVFPFAKKNSPSDIKVILNKDNEVLYMSRSDVPSDSRTDNLPLLKAYHIVPFTKDFLIEFSKLHAGEIEQIEFIEYMRVLEHGRKIKAYHVHKGEVSVDTQKDLDYVRRKMLSDNIFPKYKDSKV